MTTQTVYYDQPEDEELFRQHIRMECHLAGYEVVDYDMVGHDGRPYVTFRKKPTRQPRKPKQRFF